MTEVEMPFVKRSLEHHKLKLQMCQKIIKTIILQESNEHACKREDECAYPANVFMQFLRTNKKVNNLF